MISGGSRFAKLSIEKVKGRAGNHWLARHHTNTDARERYAAHWHEVASFVVIVHRAVAACGPRPGIRKTRRGRRVCNADHLHEGT
jgi:hypothetical protein